MKNTLGPDRNVLSLLVFGEYPKVYTRSEVPSLTRTTEDRAAMLHAARAEMHRHIAQMRIDLALTHHVQVAVDSSNETGNKVLDWRKKSKEIALASGSDLSKCSAWNQLKQLSTFKKQISKTRVHCTLSK
eukprot:IDg18021t1